MELDKEKNSKKLMKKNRIKQERKKVKQLHRERKEREKKNRKEIYHRERNKQLDRIKIAQIKNVNKS